MVNLDQSGFLTNSKLLIQNPIFEEGALINSNESNEIILEDERKRKRRKMVVDFSVEASTDDITEHSNSNIGAGHFLSTGPGNGACRE